MNRQVIFFGASEAGRRALWDWPADLPVAYVVDNDSTKWGTGFCGVPVRAPDVLLTEPFDSTFVVITSRWAHDIARQLANMGFSPDLDFASVEDALQILRRPIVPEPPADATVMVFEDHWFGVDYGGLREALARSGIRSVAARVPPESARADLDLDRDNYRSLRVHGVPLYDACVFDVCVACRVTADRLDPADAGHWRVIEEHMRCAAAAARLVERWLDGVRPDAVVIPQGHVTICAVYRYLAVLRGIRVIALENSLNDRRLVWDDLAGIAVNKIPARNYYWRWSDLVDAATATDYVNGYLSSIKGAKAADHQSPARRWSGAGSTRPVVLYLANVLTDSSVLFSSRVGSQVDAIKAAARWALEHECTFLLKVHPRERPGSPLLRRAFPPAEFSYEGLTVQALREDQEFWQRLTTSDRCVVDADNRFDTYDLIRQSDVCVTVCSQAGLEALLLGRETVVLGDAYYGGLGFTHDAQNIDQIGTALGAALDPASRLAAPARVAKFFYIFAQLYCVEKSTAGVASLIRRAFGRERLPVLPVSA